MCDDGRLKEVFLEPILFLFFEIGFLCIGLAVLKFYRPDWPQRDLAASASPVLD